MKRMTTVPILVLCARNLEQLGARVASLYRKNPERSDPTKSVALHLFNDSNPREFSFPTIGTWLVVVVVTTRQDIEWQEAMCRACAATENGEVGVRFFIVKSLKEASEITDEYLAAHLPTFVA